MDKNGDTIASAITNLDLHDISRAPKTYGVKSFYIVTPIVDQQELVKRIIAHWVTGFGAQYNPKRQQALNLIKLQASLDDTISDICGIEGVTPKTIVTSARHSRGNINYRQCRKMIKNGKPYLLNFGTAWGLADEIISSADYFLDPITGQTLYKHLSVRSAASIILDRLLGVEEIRE